MVGIMTGIIVANGSIEDYSFYKKYFDGENLVIAADGGAFHLRRLGVEPDILLGDFDSISKEDYNFYNKSNIELLEYPKKKDATDTEIAISEAVKRGCNKIIIIGGVGSRFDHSISNVFLLKQMLDKGVIGIVVNEYNEIYLVRDRISVEAEKGYKLSLLPVTERVEGITTKGLYYELADDTIELGSSRGISNEFLSDNAEILIKNGTLMVIKSKD
ncbi:thiamine diphosphokinase [Herbivorax sp. ANBcel31]|uniref:thiamine diphosphokinase n=1 Tax=Herbivorax sp. ANBcel31 TaxID=3069754 RepID=UPI0027B1806A|nr:thiamine diphosphokinase [Herbivorax sp. ANBcel31]MDQ2087160.1 thiamine diphosphokinase [Herbivorax sp. ANBcel31]